VVTQIHHRTFDAVNALPHREFRQPDHHRLRLARWGGVYLHLDRNGVDTEQREGAEPGEHTISPLSLVISHWFLMSDRPRTADRDQQYPSTKDQ
jgi:hypothetical protein